MNRGSALLFSIMITLLITGCLASPPSAALPTATPVQPDLASVLSAAQQSRTPPEPTTVVTVVVTATELPTARPTAEGTEQISTETTTPSATATAEEISTETLAPSATATVENPEVIEVTQAPDNLRLRATLPSINIRSGPNTSFRIVGYLVSEQEADVLGRNRNGTWLNISLNERIQGWVAASVVELVGGNLEQVEIAVTIPILPTPTPTSTPTRPAATSIPTRSSGSGSGGSSPTAVPAPPTNTPQPILPTATLNPYP